MLLASSRSSPPRPARLSPSGLLQARAKKGKCLSCGSSAWLRASLGPAAGSIQGFNGMIKSYLEGYGLRDVSVKKAARGEFQNSANEVHITFKTVEKSVALDSIDWYDLASTKIEGVMVTFFNLAPVKRRT